MYLEIHPFWYDSGASLYAAQSNLEKKEKDFYTECPARVINLTCIRQISPEKSYDESIELTRLQISDDHTEDVIVAKEEGEKIKKILLGGGGQEGKNVAEELEILTGVLRNIEKILQARLH